MDTVCADTKQDNGHSLNSSVTKHKPGLKKLSSFWDLNQEFKISDRK